MQSWEKVRIELFEKKEEKKMKNTIKKIGTQWKESLLINVESFA